MLNQDKRPIPFVLFLAFLKCAGNPPAPEGHFSLNLLSQKLKEQLHEVSESVVGVQAIVKYNVEKFDYVTVDGQFVSDPNSLLKYKVKSGNGGTGIGVEKDEKVLSGGGLILDRHFDGGRYVILTSSHLVAPQDTTELYYQDENGLQTDVILARYIITSVSILVRHGNHLLAGAELICHDGGLDLAVIELETERRLGTSFRKPIGYDLNIGWGDWVFIFGYPNGIKQLTGGWVSEGPYRNSLAVDAVVRHGYSGGPVFGISPGNQELAFVGLIKSVPKSTFDYIAPDIWLPPGDPIRSQDLNKLVVKSQSMVDYGTAYFVSPRSVKRFFQLKE
ncbi:serine protease, partial [bacterium]|nr:serine protease [bacterium]